MQVWNAAHNVCKDMVAAKALSFKQMLSVMTMKPLEDLLQYLKHDKTNAEKKYEKIIEFTDPIIKVLKVESMITITLEKAHELMKDAVIIECNADGAIKMSSVIKEVEIAIAVLKDKMMAD